jgi:mediator of RNA polymerase II transcription subunit 5
VAAFDVLSNAVFRSEPRQTVFLLRSFLVNKVPLLLTTALAAPPPSLAPVFAPPVPEFCINRALSHVDSHAFPSFSAMFDVATDSGMIPEVRQEFLFACCLHGLIPEASIEPLLGEIPMQELPPGGKYTRELLIHQYASDPGWIDRLLGEIEGLDGNAGAVVGAIVEVRFSSMSPPFPPSVTDKDVLEDKRSLSTCAQRKKPCR